MQASSGTIRFHQMKNRGPSSPEVQPLSYVDDEDFDLENIPEPPLDNDIGIDFDAIPDWDRFRFAGTLTQEALRALPAKKRQWIERRLDQINELLSNPIQYKNVAGTEDARFAPKPLPFEAASNKPHKGREDMARSR